MANFQHITAARAQEMLQNQQAQLVDIRDAASFTQGHIDGAQRIDNSNLSKFIEKSNKSAPLIVCCYHGISSQNAAEFFTEQGFAEVYSLDGGFEGWKSRFPFTTSEPSSAS